MTSLQEACSLFNLDNDGTRPILVHRLIDYLIKFSENKLQSTFLIKKPAPKTYVITEDDIKEKSKKRKIVENIDDDSESEEVQKKKSFNENSLGSDEFVFLSHEHKSAKGTSSDTEDESEEDGEDNTNFELMSNATME